MNKQAGLVFFRWLQDPADYREKESTSSQPCTWLLSAVSKSFIVPSCELLLTGAFFIVFVN